MTTPIKGFAPICGAHSQLGVTLANLAIAFRDLERAEVAATIYGCSTRYPSICTVTSLPDLIERLVS